MAERRGLGRGLGALIPPAQEPATTDDDAPTVNTSVLGLQYREVRLDQVSVNPRQPRKVFDEDAIAELAASIDEIGLLQPMVVRETADGYELIAGERRLRACRSLAMAVVPVLVRETQDDKLLRDALLENLQRVQLNPLEEASAYSQLLSDFDCTQEELAKRLGRSRPQVSNTLRLLKLPPAVQKRVAAGVLSAGHARALLSFEDPDAMETVAARIVAEGLSVRSVEELALMEGPVTPARKRTRVRRDPPVEYLEAQDRFADLLSTRVRIQMGAKRGRVVIDFSGVDDLARILDIVASGAGED